MKLGLIARSDNSGLGMQTLEFYRHMKPDKTMVVDISKYNNNKTYPERYSDNLIGDVIFVTGFPTPSQVDYFLADLDLVFIAEAAYSPYVYTRAKELGVKTANQYNYEFFEWFNSDTPRPDMFIAPSRWHYEDVQKFCDDNQIAHTYLHCPVNRKLLPYRENHQAKTFLHVAGRSAAWDRNGTETVILASHYIKSNAKILIHFQGEQGLPHQATATIDDYKKLLAEKGDPSKVEIVQVEYENYQDVYKQGEVLLLPRRYGGNCLPLNEALSVGMPVIMSNISPNNQFLPREWLVAADYLKSFTPRTRVEVYNVPPQALAKKIDQFAEMGEGEFMSHNVKASNLAESISWENMQWRYLQEFEKLCTP